MVEVQRREGSRTRPPGRPRPGIWRLIKKNTHARSTGCADLPWPQRILSFLLRTAFVLALALGLGRVAKTAYAAKICTVYVVDVSESMATADPERFRR